MIQSAKTCLLFISLLTLNLSGVAAKARELKTVALEDLKTWRESAVSLSDDGNWYTVLYSLLEKPEAAKAGDAKAKPQKTDGDPDQKAKAERDIALYGDKNRSDVLYIRQAATDREYAVAGAVKPLFSPDSQWIAYTIQAQSPANKDQPAVGTIELRHLASGRTRSWKSKADYRFSESGPCFVCHDKTGLLLIDLRTEKEHYIGNIGEFVLDRKSPLLLYAIASPDRRGNGLYLYDLTSRSTRALDNETCLYGRIAWNQDCSAVSAVKFGEDPDGRPERIRLLTCRNVTDAAPIVDEFPSEAIAGLPEGMQLDVGSVGSDGPAWSRDNSRLFVRLTKKPSQASQEEASEPASVDVWHGLDKKLVSQQMMEAEREAQKTDLAVFYPKNRKMVRLTGPDLQSLVRAPDSDRWAIGEDERSYVSDWDVRKRDLYRIDLIGAELTPILSNYAGELHVSPDGERALLWHDGQYWCYEFAAGSLSRIGSQAGVSFRDQDHDQFGSDPDYGFVGWLKGCRAVVVNHHLDLWLLPIEDQKPAENLTGAVRNGRSIRFRFHERDFSAKELVEERTIDLSRPQILTAFDILSKEAGYYQLQERTLKPLLYGAFSFTASGWRRSGDLLLAKQGPAVIYRRGTVSDYPEAYLGDRSFGNARRLTVTNPQQSGYRWGRRRLIDYKNDDGAALQGILTVPDSYRPGQKLPMIVYSYEKLSQNLHQYPSMRISGSSVVEMMYVSDGYLYLQPDIRFHIGTPHSDMHECLDAAIAEVVRLGYADEKHIGYEGFSFGGHCGMYVSTQKNRFAAIAAGAGVSDLVQGFTVDIVGDGSNEQDYYMTSQGRLGTDPSAGLETYLRESAVFQAHKLQTPLLLFHGGADNVVQWEHSFGLYSILRFLKKPVIFLSYRGEGHGLKKTANRLDLQRRLKEFFDHHLKGCPAPAWMSEGVPIRPPAGKTGEADKKEAAPRALWR